jgi:hypothetical protein
MGDRATQRSRIRSLGVSRAMEALRENHCAPARYDPGLVPISPVRLHQVLVRRPHPLVVRVVA